MKNSKRIAALIAASVCPKTPKLEAESGLKLLFNKNQAKLLKKQGKMK